MPKLRILLLDFLLLLLQIDCKSLDAMFEIFNHLLELHTLSTSGFLELCVLVLKFFISTPNISRLLTGSTAFAGDLLEQESNSSSVGSKQVVIQNSLSCHCIIVQHNLVDDHTYLSSSTLFKSREHISW